MSDSRDSNHDGKVSFMEKIKHKLHKGSKDKDSAEYTTFHTSTAAPTTQPCNCATCLEAVGFPPAQAGAYSNGGYDPRHGHQLQTAPAHLQGQQLQNPGQFVSYPAGSQVGGYSGGVIPAAVAAVPLAGAVPLTGTPLTGTAYPSGNYNTGAYPAGTHVPGAYDSRDTNGDGRVSMGEKLNPHTHSGVGTSHAHSGVGGYDSRDRNGDGRVSMGEKIISYEHGAAHKHSGVGGYDSRDTNGDGRVSMGEKLGAHTHSGVGTSHAHSGVGGYDSRDRNGDGRVSMGEKLGAHTHSGVGGYDSRDTNGDGRVSMGEKLAHNIGSRATDETRLTLHEEQLAVSKRQVSAGVVGLTKRVQEERVQHRVPVKREELIVERRPLTGIAGEHAGTPYPDEISRVTIYREDIVTHTRLVPTEEIIVRKKIVTEQQAVGATLRSERMETTQTQTAPTQLAVSNVSGGAYDARDSNMDGHLSAGERLHAATGSSAGAHDARDSNMDGRLSASERLHAATAGSAGPYDARDSNMDGRLSASERLHAATGSSAAVGVHDARDTNMDGRVSVGEKLKGATGNHNNASGAAYDARDTNMDGRVSVGEKLKGATGNHNALSTGAGYDARDTNMDGHVSVGEKLKGATGSTGNYNGAAVGTGAHDSRDTNLDGHVSTGEKLASDAQALKAARG